MIATAHANIKIIPSPVSNCRFDVIAIRKLKSADQPDIVNFENAIP